MGHRRKGETYNAFAERVGCDPSYISKLVNGVRRPSIFFLEATASRLELSKDERDRLLVLAYDIGRKKV